MEKFLMGKLNTTNYKEFYTQAFDCIIDNKPVEHGTSKMEESVKTHETVSRKETKDELTTKLFTVKDAFRNKTELAKTQTYTSWKAGYKINWFRKRKLSKRKTIYMLPFSDVDSNLTENRIVFDGEKISILDLCCKFGEIYFSGFGFHRLPDVKFESLNWKITSRTIASKSITSKSLSSTNITCKIQENSENTRQFLVRDFYKPLHQMLPSNGYCIMGITGASLYPGDDYKAVLGESSFLHRSGVFTLDTNYNLENVGESSQSDSNQILLQYNIDKSDCENCKNYDCDSSFSVGPLRSDQVSGNNMGDNSASDDSNSVIHGLLIWKAFRILSHELCHLFNLQHCPYFLCAMNESTTLHEAMQQPLFLCPVCLRKLQHVCRFDLWTHYKKLRQFLSDVHDLYPCDKFRPDLLWLDKCLGYCESFCVAIIKDNNLTCCN